MEPPAETRSLALMPRMDPRLLRGFEHVSVPVCTWVNALPGIKRPVQRFVRYVTSSWIYELNRRRLHVHGTDNVVRLDPSHGVLLVSNHRSFFDMYVTLAWLYKNTNMVGRIHFPVRSGFFYTNPLGLLINLGVSGGAMWPPVFRDSRKSALNPVGVDQTLHVLGQEKCFVGVHPEGTRSQDPDPYTYLPPRPGVGVLVKRTHPETLVLPFFIAGLSNSVMEEIRRDFSPSKSEPLRVWFGRSVRAAEAATWGEPQQIAEKLMAQIAAEGEKDRAYRKTIMIGDKPRRD